MWQLDISFAIWVGHSVCIFCQHEKCHQFKSKLQQRMIVVQSKNFFILSEKKHSSREKNQILVSAPSILQILYCYCIHRGITRLWHTSKMKSLSAIIYFFKGFQLRCFLEPWIRLRFGSFSMVERIYTLKHEPFSLMLFWSDSAVGVDDDDAVEKNFLKLFIVSKKKILTTKSQKATKK